MKKRILAILLICFVLIFSACGVQNGEQPVGENLLSNGGFEAETGSAVTDWGLDRYDTAPPVEYYQAVLDDTAPQGDNSLKIESTTFNDARFIQKVQVLPNSYYCLSAMVKTENTQQRQADSGANIGFLQTHCKSEFIKGKTDWQKVTVYGKTGDETTEVTVALRLGYYSADASGLVFFDDVSLTRVESVPDGAYALSMDSFEFAASSNNDKKEEKGDATTDSIQWSTVLWGIITFGVLALFFWWMVKGLNLKAKDAYILIGIALVLRLIASVCFAGFKVDIGCFSAWGAKMAKDGLTGFYQEGYFCDYPPFYMIVLGIISAISGTLDLTSGFGLLLLKLPAVLCDIIAAVMIVIIAKKHVSEKLAAALGVAYAFLPTAIVNSALWGQVDSVLVLFMLITFWLIDEDKFGPSVLVYFIGLLFKPQAVLFGPVMLLAAAREFYLIYRNDNKKARLIKGFGFLGASVALFALVSVIMQNDQEPLWLVNKYMDTLGSYNYATLSSFGLMGLLGGQWVDATKTCIFGISYSLLGTILLFAVVIGMTLMFIYLITRKKTMESRWFWLLGAFMLAGAVTVSTRTHERYMFPVIIMLIMGFVRFKDIRLLLISFSYALLNFINTAGLLFLYETLEKYFAADDVVFVLGSLLTVVLFAYQTYVTIKLMLDEKNTKPIKLEKKPAVKAKTSAQASKLFLRKGSKLPKIKLRDVIICLIITVIYGCIAFTDLGDTKAAEDFWYTNKTKPYAVADLGEAKEFDNIKYYTDIVSGSFEIYVSEDGENYNLLKTIVIDENGAGWSSADVSGKARYVKIQALTPVDIEELIIEKDQTPLEIITTEQKIVPLDNVSATAENLFDNQAGDVEEPASWRVTSVSDYVYVDFGQVTKIDRGAFMMSLSEGTFNVYYSNDLLSWSDKESHNMEKSNLYYWHGLPANNSSYASLQARYVLVEGQSQFLKLIEMGFFENKESTTTIPIKEIVASNTALDGGAALFNEQELVPYEGATYENSMYFDEIYHARTAYESANGLSIYEWTHPPLGKDMMSWCVSLMGMTPFAWRFAGTLAGVLMLPGIYFLALLLFKKTSWATMATVLMAFDGMHFVQTRIATIDSFGVLFIIYMFLFMYWYYSISFYEEKLWKTFIPLGLCGLAFGLGAASKWICLYAGAGLAVIFFITMGRRIYEYVEAGKLLNKARGEEREYYLNIRKVGVNYICYTILFCILAFIIIPVIIYCASYYPYWNAVGETRKWYEIILDNQEAMFSYHAYLDATHPYQSDWYTWPVMSLPMFYYTGPAAPDKMAVIYAFGNPAVWYSGLVCTLGAVVIFVYHFFGLKLPVRREEKGFFNLFSAGDEHIVDKENHDMWTLLFLIIGIICNLAPWVGIERCIFIYHYFASVPFIILFTVYILRFISRKNVKIGTVITIVLAVLAIVLFIMFKPVWTGTEVKRDYVEHYLQWLPTWFGYWFS